MALIKRTYVIGLAIVSLAGLFWLVAFPPAHSRVYLNHRRAAENILRVHAAQRQYVTQHSSGMFACAFDSLALDELSKSGTRSGYKFEIHCDQDGSDKAKKYTITAVHLQPGVTGEYAVCADQSGTIWYSENGSPSDCLRIRAPIGSEYR